jgi:hypothetical protein
MGSPIILLLHHGWDPEGGPFALRLLSLGVGKTMPILLVT